MTELAAVGSLEVQHYHTLVCSHNKGQCLRVALKLCIYTNMKHTKQCLSKKAYSSYKERCLVIQTAEIGKAIKNFSFTLDVAEQVQEGTSVRMQQQSLWVNIGT